MNPEDHGDAAGIFADPIAACESVYLSYVSANREDVFDDPFRFDVGRDPNKH